MSVGYDAVIYSAGTVQVGDPAGFAELHYDPVPSPLGNGGFGINDVFGDVYATSGFGGPASYIEQFRDPNLFYGNVGNRASFGFGTPSFINTPQNYYYSNRSVSGLQNYNFGATNAIASATGAAAVGSIAGIFNGFNRTGDGPDSIIDRGFTTGASNRAQAVQNEFINVVGNQAEDVSIQPLPPNITALRTQQAQRFADESIRSNSGDNSRPLQSQSSEPYNLSTYTGGDSPVSNTTAELITNNPGSSDIPSSPWG